MSNVYVEICCFSLMDAIAADAGGAHRIELCADAALGGVTPSLGLVRTVKEAIAIPTWVIVRPRGGHFVYDQREQLIMLREIDYLCSLGVEGVVLGCLDKMGNIDRAFIEMISDHFPQLPLSFHKAIDVSSQIDDSIQQLIDYGFVRVLTSGGAPHVIKGLSQLIRLQQLFGHQIQIMAGGSVRLDTLPALINGGIQHLHTSLRLSGWPQEEFQYISPEQVKDFVSQAQTIASSAL
jgi:copper homeostasis protein